MVVPYNPPMMSLRGVLPGRDDEAIWRGGDGETGMNCFAEFTLNELEIQSPSTRRTLNDTAKGSQ